MNHVDSSVTLCSMTNIANRSVVAPLRARLGAKEGGGGTTGLGDSGLHPGDGRSAEETARRSRGWRGVGGRSRTAEREVATELR